MKTVAAIYTGHGLEERMRPIFRELLPDCRVVTILDDTLIADVMQAGKVDAPVADRLRQYFTYAERMGVDAILNTCSSVGEVAETAKHSLRTPLIRIDEAMAQEAVQRYDSIGVVATLRTTLAPTVGLIRKQAEQLGKQVSVHEALAQGAYDALVTGRADEHDRLIMQAAQAAAERVSALVLAQGSMVRMEQELRNRTGIPVLSSPRLGVMAVKRILEVGDMDER